MKKGDKETDLENHMLWSGGHMSSEAVATNLVTVRVANRIPVFETNLVSVPVTNYVANSAALATIDATGNLVTKVSQRTITRSGFCVESGA